MENVKLVEYEFAEKTLKYHNDVKRVFFDTVCIHQDVKPVESVWLGYWILQSN